MLLKAIGTICDHRGTFSPGDVFTVESEKESKRLIDLGAAIPARKTITIEMAVSETAKETE